MLRNDLRSKTVVHCRPFYKAGSFLQLGTSLFKCSAGKASPGAKSIQLPADILFSPDSGEQTQAIEIVGIGTELIAVVGHNRGYAGEDIALPLPDIVVPVSYTHLRAH